MATLAAAEPENSNEESPPEGSASKSPPNKRPVPVPSPPKTTNAPAAPSKKGLVSNLCSQLSIFFYFFRAAKDVPPIEILPDEPEPFSFAGQLLITGISLTCRLITVEIQQTNLYRFIQLPSLTNLSMPLPIIPILQSGPIYPGKQSIIRYFMLIPTPKMIHNEEVNNRNASLFHESL